MASTAIVTIIVWILFIYQIDGQRVGWYSCPESCTGACRCASDRSPVPNPPQFILLTHDDAVTSFSASTVLNALKGLKNPNGCDLPATFYVSIKESLDYLIHHLYMSNHEIADHTFNHPHLPDETEISSAIQWISDNAGVPKEEIRGFRAPYLEHNIAQRQTLYKLGLKYDASITEQPGDNQLFPYSLDYGVAVDCSKGTGECAPSESYPGMWSVPLWTLPRATSMDIPGDVKTQYMREFRKKLYGNRAPLGIFCHSGWLNTNLQAVREFLSEALAMSEDVWVVTNWQLIQWMQNPVSAKEYRQQMTRSNFCPRSPKGPAPPSGGCVFGTWDKDLYRCRCQGEGIQSNGFCRDSDGACTQSKVFSDAGIWHCPGESTSSLLSIANTVADHIQLINQQIPEDIKHSVQENIQNVNDRIPARIKRSLQDVRKRFSAPGQNWHVDRRTGVYIFYGIEIPEHPEFSN